MLRFAAGEAFQAGRSVVGLAFFTTWCATSRARLCARLSARAAVLGGSSVFVGGVHVSLRRFEVSSLAAFPRQTQVISPEVTVGSRVVVDRSLELQELDDAVWRELELAFELTGDLCVSA